MLSGAPFRAVWFDAVGTVLFPHPPALSVYAEAACRRGLMTSPEDVKARFIQAYRLEEAKDRSGGWSTSEARERERWRHIVLASLPGAGDDVFEELFAHFARPDAWRLAPDVGEVFGALAARGIVIGLGSNYDSRLASVVAGFPELASIRDRAVISSLVGRRKPAAAFFDAVVRAAGCSPADVIFVGDDIDNDYRGAAAAGLGAVLLDPDRRHHKAPSRIERLSDLL